MSIRIAQRNIERQVELVIAKCQRILSNLLLVGGVGRLRELARIGQRRLIHQLPCSRLLGFLRCGRRRLTLTHDSVNRRAQSKHQHHSAHFLRSSHLGSLSFGWTRFVILLSTDGDYYHTLPASRSKRASFDCGRRLSRISSSPAGAANLLPCAERRIRNSDCPRLERKGDWSGLRHSVSSSNIVFGAI